MRGLAENTFVSAESLLTFAYGAASQSVQALLGEHAKDKGETKMSAGKLEGCGNEFKKLQIR